MKSLQFDEYADLWEFAYHSQGEQQPQFSFIAVPEYGAPAKRLTTIANGIVDTPENAIKALERYNGDDMVN